MGIYVELSEEQRAEVRKSLRRRPLLWMVALYLLVAVPLAPLGHQSYREYQELQRKQLYPVREGKIIDRYHAPFLRFLTRPVYVIEPDREVFTVRAMLIQNKLFDFPNHVQFYFSGDRAEEVRLLGETNPWDMVLFFFLLPFCFPLIIACVLIAERIRGKPKSGTA